MLRMFHVVILLLLSHHMNMELLNKQKAVLTFKATKQNKRGSKILIKTNYNKYHMNLK